MIILTADKKLAPDFPFLIADKNWHQNFAFQSRWTMAVTPTLVTTTTTSYHEEDINLDTDLETSAVVKQLVAKSICEGYK